MQDIKIGYVHQSLWHSILVCLVLLCPFLATADQHATQSDIQEIAEGQNQSLPQVTRQDIRDIRTTLIEQHETLTTLSTKSTVILGVLLFVILIFLIWMFFQYRILASELDNVKHRIAVFTRTNNELKDSLLDIHNRMRRLEKNFDSDILSQKLIDVSENNTQKVIDLVKSIIDRITNDSSLTSQEVLESSKQETNHTSERILPPAIVELCNRYDAGIQDRKKQGDFLQLYNKHYKIYVENAMDRRVKQQTKPIFKTHPASGNFLGCYVEKEKLYAVVPAYQLRIEHTILHYGAFVDVFECLELDSERCYEVVKIIEPAIFEPDDAKEIWTLRSKGSLELKEV